jgi:hypothetical protein
MHIECDEITLITLPSLRQEFSDITFEIFDLAFTLATFSTFRACTSWYKLQKVFVGLLMTLPVCRRNNWQIGPRLVMGQMGLIMIGRKLGKEPECS